MSKTSDFCFVIRLGFEPKTHSLEGCCSIQLSYRTDPCAFCYSVAESGCKDKYLSVKKQNLFAESLSDEFYACDKRESDEGEEGGAAVEHTAGCIGLGEGFGIGPGPNFDEGADDEAGEDDEGFFVPAGEEPVEELGEAEDADDGSDGEYAEDEEVTSEFYS